MWMRVGLPLERVREVVVGLDREELPKWKRVSSRSNTRVFLAELGSGGYRGYGGAGAELFVCLIKASEMVFQYFLSASELIKKFVDAAWRGCFVADLPLQ